MTVSTSYTALEYSGNGSTTAFPVTWPFFSGTLVVTSVAADGTETVKTIVTDYTVSGGTASTGLPSTGTVTMLSAPSSGTTLRIERVTPKTQSSTWGENDPFPQKVIEAAFDRSMLISQESAADRGRAVVSSITDYASTGQLTMPSPEADKLIGWNADADGLENKNAASFSLTIGTVTTGAAGTSASATLTGSSTDAVLNLTIPRGDEGLAGAGSGDVLVSSTFTAANRLVATANTSKTIKETPVTEDGSGNIAGVTSITVSNTGLHLLDTNATHDLIIAPGSNLTADRTLTVTTGDANRGLTLSADLNVSGAATVSGSNTGDQNLFSTIAVSGQSNVVADAISDTLTLAAGSGITITTDAATDTITIASSGSGTAATQAEQEAASSTSVYVTPGRQQYHPSAAKAWVKFNNSGTIAASYNITSITDNGVGSWSVNIATDFSSAEYVGVVTTNGTNLISSGIVTSAGVFAIGTLRPEWDGSTLVYSAVDATVIFAAFFGDQ